MLRRENPCLDNFFRRTSSGMFCYWVENERNPMVDCKPVVAYPKTLMHATKLALPGKNNSEQKLFTGKIARLKRFFSRPCAGMFCPPNQNGDILKSGKSRVSYFTLVEASVLTLMPSTRKLALLGKNDFEFFPLCRHLHCCGAERVTRTVTARAKPTTGNPTISGGLPSPKREN